MKQFALALLSLILPLGAAHAAVDFGRPTSRTPYDGYLGPVQEVLQQNASKTGAAPSMEEARELLKKGRSFRYEFDEPYRPQAPAATEQQQAGDCKDKSLWLMDKMDDPSVQFVVGKARRSSTENHAWLLWEKEGRWWILDPTHSREPIAANSVSKSAYLPLYSFSRSGKRVHGVAASAQGRNTRTAVAAGRR